ncbi:TetR/AcrR family transcriptional regulator [Litoreibacter roseus]|uniref:TetR family transcriptional regulator n=1 Tax=Litoreibacter roseus TaxID=2601869 RepID=A0A6N6JCQ9_9RHOB|nr:TetR/AcrR family transcriptional regulator [Litoreibacter roseus]GFE63935.1 TetR family transcriptional regulator [Litoreibacter roseus]
MTKSPETSKKTSYHHGDLRAQLVEATRQLVEEKGADHFSVSEACRRAGVSTAAPYKHFKDKEEMLNQVILEGMHRKQQQMQDELAKYPDGGIDRIIALGRVYVRFAEQEPGVFRLMFGLTEDHENEDQLVAEGKRTFGAVQAEVARYRGSEVVEDQDIDRAFMLWSFVHGLSFLQIDGKVSTVDVSVDMEHILREIAERVMA